MIDVKADLIAYHSAIPLAKEDGTQSVIAMPNLKARVAKLHQQNLYLTARILTFKDDKLASAEPAGRELSPGRQGVKPRQADLT